MVVLPLAVQSIGIQPKPAGSKNNLYPEKDIMWDFFQHEDKSGWSSAEKKSM